MRKVFKSLSLSSYLFTRNDNLFNTIRCIVPNILDFKNAQLTKILFYVKENLDNMDNTSILDATIIYLIGTKRFEARLF